MIAPADRIETAAVTKSAAAHDGRVLLRLSRVGVPELLPGDHVFVPGKANLLCDGADVTLIANGVPTHRAMAAAEVPEARGGPRGC